jgi:imidazolonepropionase-like amidohydrolase
LRYLFKNASIFDGETHCPNGSALLIENERIVALSPANAFDGIDAGVVDCAGLSILPGLIDCHVHLCFGAESQLIALLGQMNDAQLASRALQNAHATLRAGVTTVRDLGGVRNVEISVRNEIRAGRWPGPTILASGRMICMTGGHGWFVGIEADGALQVRAAIRANIKAGADVIKMMATGGVMTPGVDPLAAHFTLEELQAGVDEARRLGRKVASHALGQGGVLNAVAAGVASIEHGFELPDDVIRQMIEGQVTLVPTLSAIGVIERAAYAGIAPDLAERAQRFAEMHRASVLRFYRSGGRIAMGTDAGTPLNHHGANAQELGFMTALGISAPDALRAATSAAADLLGLADRGRLKPGAAADLLVVRGEIETDLSSVIDSSCHRLVLKDGQDVRRLLPRDAEFCSWPLALDDSPF